MRTDGDALYRLGASQEEGRIGDRFDNRALCQDRGANATETRRAAQLHYGGWIAPRASWTAVGCVRRDGEPGIFTVRHCRGGNGHSLRPHPDGEDNEHNERSEAGNWAKSHKMQN
jgi:hypothetical protein